MTMLKIDPFISRVVVIGGGRWARVIVGVLHRILPVSISLSVHSQRNVSVLERSFQVLEGGSRVKVSADWPDLKDARDCAVIVVNAARDHAQAVRRALEAGAAVLVEKPVALTATDVENLILLSQKKGLLLAAAHVLMFASYLDHFVEKIALGGRVQSICIHWADPRLESRYGEQKSYDPGVPIHFDCLPHVLSILDKILPGEDPLLENLEFLRGGARVVLSMSFGQKTCVVSLERHALKRKRWIEVKMESGLSYQLDFSREPGRIFDGQNWCNGDQLSWQTSLSPLTTMLTSFLFWASGGEMDARLNCAFGLLVSKFADKVQVKYQKLQSEWLFKQLSGAELAVPEDIDYALSELVQVHGRLSDNERVHRIQELSRSFCP